MNQIISRFAVLLLAVSMLAACSDGGDRDRLPLNAEDYRKNFYSHTDTTKLDLPDSVWKQVLPDSVYATARNAATERPFTGKYWDATGRGTYYCAACGNELFRADGKFASTCGWPSFFQTARESSVVYKPDSSAGMVRTEVLCGRCDAHLGHLFDDGPPPTGKRYCMNSVVLDFLPDK